MLHMAHGATNGSLQKESASSVNKQFKQTLSSMISLLSDRDVTESGTFSEIRNPSDT